VEKVMLLGLEPVTTADWYARAIQVDNQYRRTKAMMERYRGKRDANARPKLFYRKPERQYEPMDTSAGRLTVEEQRNHFEKRLCYNCHKPGHLARECRGGQHNQYSPPVRPANHRDALTRIRNITAELEGAEKEILLQTMEKEGFL
jgi:hypothetical protein